MVRKIPAAHQSVVCIRDDRYNFVGENLKGKTLGIIGMGRNGKLISDYAKAFDMRVIYNDIKKKGNCFVNLKQLFKSSDIISVNVELNKKTKKLVNWDLLKNIKKKVFIINTSRAEILDQKSIIRAINKNLLSGIALDFLEKNKNKYTKSSIRLINLAKKSKNIILTPHIGGVTTSSFNETEKFIFQNFIRHVQKISN